MVLCSSDEWEPPRNKVEIDANPCLGIEFAITIVHRAHSLRFGNEWGDGPLPFALS